MPLAGYAAILGVYNAAFLGLLFASDDKESESPEKCDFGDFLLLSVATYKLSRIISSDRITSPLRAPFTEYIEPAGTSEVKEKVRGRGLQRAVGDLLTCPFCLAPWIAGALAFGFVFKPKMTRIMTRVFSAAAGSDVLQYGYGALKEKQ